jgi:hypothetical protein
VTRDPLAVPVPADTVDVMVSDAHLFSVPMLFAINLDDAQLADHGLVIRVGRYEGAEVTIAVTGPHAGVCWLAGQVRAAFGRTAVAPAEHAATVSST